MGGFSEGVSSYGQKIPHLINKSCSASFLSCLGERLGPFLIEHGIRPLCVLTRRACSRHTTYRPSGAPLPKEKLPGLLRFAPILCRTRPLVYTPGGTPSFFLRPLNVSKPTFGPFQEGIWTPPHPRSNPTRASHGSDRLFPVKQS